MEEFYKGFAQRARDLAEKADPITRRRLLDLAQIDTAISQANHRKQTLPVLAQLKELGAQRQVLSDELTAANARLRRHRPEEIPAAPAPRM